MNLCRQDTLAQEAAKWARSKPQKKAFTDAWLAVLRRPLPLPDLHRALSHLPDSVIPHLTDPLLLSDFLTRSVDSGGHTFAIRHAPPTPCCSHISLHILGYADCQDCEESHPINSSCPLLINLHPLDQVQLQMNLSILLYICSRLPAAAFTPGELSAINSLDTCMTCVTIISPLTCLCHVPLLLSWEGLSFWVFSGVPLILCVASQGPVMLLRCCCHD